MTKYPMLSPESNAILRDSTAQARVVTDRFSAEANSPGVRQMVHKNLRMQMADFLAREKVTTRTEDTTIVDEIRLFVIDEVQLFALIREEALRYK